MIDIQSPGTPWTVRLPAELIEELETLARETQLSVDEVVREACMAYTEPYFWERCYKDWLRAHPDQCRAEFGIDGNDLTGQGPDGNVA